MKKHREHCRAMRKYQTMCHHWERPHMSYSAPRITHHAPHNHGQSSSLLDGKLDGAAKGCFASRTSSLHVRQHAMREESDHGVRCKLTPHTACLSASRRAERAQDAIVRLCVVRGAWCVVQESILQHAKHVIACGPPESGTKMVPTSISLAQLVPDLHRELS